MRLAALKLDIFKYCTRGKIYLRYVAPQNFQPNSLQVKAILGLLALAKSSRYLIKVSQTNS